MTIFKNYLERLIQANTDADALSGGGATGNYRAMRIRASGRSLNAVVMPTDVAVEWGSTEWSGYVVLDAGDSVSLSMLGHPPDEDERMIGYALLNLVKVADADGAVVTDGPEYSREQLTPGADLSFDTDSPADFDNYFSLGTTGITAVLAGTYYVFAEIDFSA